MIVIPRPDRGILPPGGRSSMPCGWPPETIQPDRGRDPGRPPAVPIPVALRLTHPIIASIMSMTSSTHVPGVAPASSAVAKRLAFISYAHDDHALFEEFRKHLDVVSLAFPSVAFQADQHIHGGQRWREEILRMIGQSDLFILLVSPSFLSSRFIIETELPAMRDRFQEVGALLLPVVLKQCLWQWVCGEVQALPCQNKRLKPILDWKPRDNGYVQAQMEIGTAIEKYFGMPMSRFDWSAKNE
jgi:hypothetical protein